VNIVVWNCCMALRAGKADRLAALEADLAIVPECSRVDAEAVASRNSLSLIWGDAPGREGREKKGLAVFARAGIELSLSGAYDRSIGVVLPVEARGDETFNIVAVWAKPPYASTVYRALGDYTPFLDSAQSVVLGDFNSNAAFEPWRGMNHLTVDGILNAMGLTSAYHAFFDEPQGEETRGTHYFLRKQDRPFHIDHCYLPREWLPGLRDVTVGSYEEWVDVSDHVPLVVSVDSALANTDARSVQNVDGRVA
jgi:hypothetical protein